LKEEALDRTLWRTGFGRDYGSVVRLLNEWWKITPNSLPTQALTGFLIRPTWNKYTGMFHSWNQVKEYLSSHCLNRTVGETRQRKNCLSYWKMCHWHYDNVCSDCMVKLLLISLAM
jgi:hypothetical protein